MNLRFVIYQLDEVSTRRVGLFQALHQIEDDFNTSIEDRRYSEEICEWFNKNLKVPSSFSKSKGKASSQKAISWFKPSAKVHIAKMYELKTFFESHGFQVDIIKSKRPGYITYEDEFQICAEPFHETVT